VGVRATYRRGHAGAYRTGRHPVPSTLTATTHTPFNPVSAVQPTGAFAALPDAGPTRPELVATGPARMLAATARGRIPDPLVLTSYDEGESWRTERVD
jgi:hypothetical protein